MRTHHLTWFVVLALLVAVVPALAADDAAGKLDRAQELFAAGQYAQAESTAREAIPGTTDVAILKGACDVVILCKLSQGDFDGAKQAAQDLKGEMAETATQAYLDEQIAEIEAKEATYEQTLAGLEQTLSAHPDDELGASAAYKIAATELFWGKQSEALAAFQRVLDQFSFSDRALLARLAMGGMHERAGRYSDAETAYDVIVQRSPDSPYAAQAVGGIKAVRLAQNDVLGARERMEDILTAHPDTEASAMAEYCKGEILLYEGKADEARAALDAVVREHYNTFAGGAAVVRRTYELMREAEALSYEGKHQEAIAKYQEVIELAPDTTYARKSMIEMGHNYAWTGNHETDRQLYERVLKDYPDSPEAIPAHYYLARWYGSQGRYEDAIPHALIVAENDTDDYRLAAAYYRLVMCYSGLRQYDQVRYWAQKIIDHEDTPQFAPRKHDAELDIALSYEAEGDLDKALSLLRSLAKDYQGTPFGDSAAGHLGRVQAEAAAAR